MCVVGVYYIVVSKIGFDTFDLKQHRVIFGVYTSKVAPTAAVVLLTILASGSCAFLT